uniref:Annexin n=1 Tax=Phytophthora ramorum TaxID=164328 RepID=H3HB94_PHYRM
MTLELYPASAHDAFHGTGIQYPAHIDEAVQQIYGACKGLGTDEQTLITVLGSKSPEVRNLVALRYKELYREPLKSLVKSETSGDFGRLLRMISTPLPETEAQILRDATKGMGTTESLIVQILSGRSNEEMNILKRSYFDLVGKDLAVTLNAELSGDFRKVVMAVLQSPQVPYNPAVHNAAKAEEEAIALYKAGQGRLGTNEEVFVGILVKAPAELLKMMDAVYVAKYNNNIVKAVDKEFSGDAKKSLNYLVRSTLDPYPAIAEVFEKTMKGFGTDETGLSTALVRYQSVLPYVKAAYKKLYHEELRDRISGETSGDYKKLLLEVFDAPHDPPRTKIKGVQGAASSTSSGGLNAAPTGAIHPAYLSAQTSYAASSVRRRHIRRRQDNSLTGKQRSAKQDMALRRTRRHNQEGIRRRHRLPNLRAEAPILQLKLRDRHQGIFPRSSSLDTLPNSHSSQATLRNNSIFNRDQDILRNNNSSSNRRSNQDIRINSRRPILLSSPATHRSNSSIRPSNHNQATVRRSIQVINRSNRGIRLNSNNRGILCSSLAILRRSRPILSSSSLATLLSNWDILLSSRDIRSLATHRNSSTLDTRQASRRTSNTHLPLANQAIHHRTELAHPTKVVATLRQADISSTQLLEDILRTEVPTTDLSSTELASSGSAIGSSASAASSTAETEAPTTIMVLLPDNLAPSYSGSGSVMFFDGSVGDDDKSKSASASSDSVAGEASGAAAGRNFEVATALTFFTILTALVVA